MTPKGLWTRVAAGVGAATAALVLLDVPRPTDSVRPAGVAAALGVLAGVTLFVALARAAPSFEPASPTLRIARTGFILTWAGVEEILWRWLALGALSARTGVPIALAISTLGFACMHSDNRRTHLVTGATFGAAYLASGQIIAAVLAHATYNTLLSESLGQRRLVGRPA